MKTPDKRLFFPATKRNRNAIGEVLKEYLPEQGCLLEIASGSGEHGVAFQKLLPGIIWQASDPNSAYRKSIAAWIDYEGLEKKMPPPLDLDVEQKKWPLPEKESSQLCGIVCINMLHISHWNCTKALFTGGEKYLSKGFQLILYGPFKISGVHTAKSNEVFDKSLRDSNQSWGVRNIEDVNEIAKTHRFKFEEVIKMPANNLTVIYTRF